VIPPDLRARSERSRIFAPTVEDRIENTGVIDRLHAAVIEHRVLRLTYQDKIGSGSERDVEPLCLTFWGGVWTLGAWCRLRRDFRNFRPDRITQFDTTDETFVESPGRDLNAYLKHVGASPMESL
jgi:predicted DNA-binding transcriptional regulator YafY